MGRDFHLCHESASFHGGRQKRYGGDVERGAINATPPFLSCGLVFEEDNFFSMVRAHDRGVVDIPDRAGICTDLDFRIL